MTYALLALLVGGTVWWELSGRGPRWRAWLEEAVYQWIVKDRRKHP
jgi:hypothetical protein